MINLKPIEKHLKKNNITIVDFAEALGVSHITVYRWFKGTREPNGYYILKMLILTGIDANDLFPTQKGSNLL